MELEVRVVQRSKGPPSSAVVLCHGFGAPGDDLVGLAQELIAAEPALSDTRFFFPAAPLSLGGFGWGDSRAWWMIDIPLLQRLQAGDPETFRAYRKQEPAGMADARELLTKVVAEVLRSTNLPASRLVLGGFSQGAMLTTDVSLRLPEPPAGLAILSGTLLLEDQWRELAKARAGLPVFQSHGRQDPLLSFTAAGWLRELLTGAGLDVEFVPFDGGHGISMEVLERLGPYLARALKVAK